MQQIAHFTCFSVMEVYPDFSNFDNDTSDPEVLDSDSNDLFRIQAGGRKPDPNYNDTFVWKELTERYGDCSWEEFYSVATVISDSMQIPLDPAQVHNAPQLLSWFENHWSIVSRVLPYVVLG